MGKSLLYSLNLIIYNNENCTMPNNDTYKRRPENAAQQSRTGEIKTKSEGCCQTKLYSF